MPSLWNARMPCHIPLASALLSGLACFSPLACAGELPRPKSWVRIADSPYPTYDAAIAYDAVRDRVVLYGGGNQTCGTWEFDGVAWSCTPNTIGQRFNSEMAFDEVRGRVMLFGSGAFMSATNTYEWTGSLWNVAAITGPQARERFSMVSDTLRQRLVLFGGIFIQGSLDNRTWEWDGASWSAASMTGPSLRSDTGAAFDAQRGRTVLFGGRTATALFSETWEWDGASWALIPTTITPPQIVQPGMVYSLKRERVLLHGGITAVGNMTGPETWSWNGQAWRVETVRGPRVASPQIVYDAARSRCVMVAIALGPPEDNSTWALPDCPGDANADGAVNMADLNAVLSHYGQTVPLGIVGDLDGDGRATFSDLNLVLSFFGSIGCN